MGAKRSAAGSSHDGNGPTKAPRGNKKSSRRQLGTCKSSPPEFSLSSVLSSARQRAEALLGSDSVAKLFDVDAKTLYLMEDHESWVLHVPGWFKAVYGHVGGESVDADAPKESYDDWFERAWEAHPKHYDTIKIFGKEAVMHRFQLACGNSDYRFSGRSFPANPFPPAFEAVVEQMKAIVTDASKQTSRLNTGLINWYENGEHYMGPHADNEKVILPQSPILALSLGAARRFVFTRRVSPKERATANTEVKTKKRSDAVEIMLNDGDLIVMGGTTQLTHKHALPKMKACTSRRISVTLRCFQTDS